MLLRIHAERLVPATPHSFLLNDAFGLRALSIGNIHDDMLGPHNAPKFSQTESAKAFR